MKNSSVIINTARGPIIDEEALIDALQTEPLLGPVWTYWNKSPQYDNPLLHMENVLVSPHVASATTACDRNLAVLVVKWHWCCVTSGR